MCGAVHLPSSSVDIQNERNDNSPLPQVFVASRLIKQKDNLIFTFTFLILNMTDTFKLFQVCLKLLNKVSFYVVLGTGSLVNSYVSS
jgi:hypothetical protein